MSFIRGIAKDSFIYGGADLLAKAVAFFTFPLLAATLSPSDYGSLELITTVIAIFSLLIGCGLSNSVQRFYWDVSIPEQQRPDLVSTGILVQLSLGLVFLIVMFLFLFLGGQKLIVDEGTSFSVIGCYAACALVIFGQLIQYVQDVLRLHFAPFKFFILAALSRCLTIAFAVYVVVFLKQGIDGFLVAQVITFVIILPFGFLLIRKDLILKFNFDYAKTVLKFGYPFIFAGIAYWLFGAIDRWMLASLATIEETGIYAVAFRFATLPLFVSIAFAQAWSPFIIKIMSEHPNTYREIYFKVFLFFFYVMLILGGGVALFSGEIIGWLMPEVYYGAAVPLSILCFVVVIQSTTQISVIGISIEKKTHLISKAAWFAVVVNVLLNFLLIPKFGAVGAAVATAITYLSLTSIYMYLTQKLHPLPIRWFPLAVMSLLGLFVLFFSIYYSRIEFDWGVFAIKMILSIICIVLGGSVLPWSRKGFENV